MTGQEHVGRDDPVADAVVRLALGLAGRAASDADEGVAAALADLGTVLGVDRVYVFEHDETDQTTSNTFEWCGAGVEPQRDNRQRVPLAIVAAWQQRFAVGREVLIADVAGLDPASSPERDVLLAQGIRALLAVPLRARGRTTGFLGVDDRRGPHAFSPRVITLLHAAAGLIGAALARRTIEEAHRALSERLQAVAAQVPGALFGFEREPDGRRRFTYVGPRFGTLLGIDPAPLADDATLALERVHDDDKAAFAASLEGSSSSLTCWEHTFRVIGGDGSVRQLIGRAAPQRRADGGVLWNGLLLDVTDEWQAAEALAQSATNLRSILETSEDAVVLIDAQRRVVDLNSSAREGARRLTGRALAIGDVITEVIDDPAFGHELDEAFAGRTVTIERAVTRPGEVAPAYWAEIRIQPARRADGHVHAVVYRSADVSERRRANDALARGAAFRQALLTLVNDLLAQAFSDELYQHVLEHAVANVPGAEAGSVVVQRGDGRYHYVAAVGFDLATLQTISYDPEELAPIQPLEATVLRPSYDNRHHTDTVQAVLRSAGRVGDIRATLVAPVDVAGDRLGYLHLDSFSDAAAFDEGAVELASLLAGTVGVALQRLRLEFRLNQERTKLQHLASHDALTDLPNRVMLADRLEQALARGRRRDRLTALLFLDLDGFKAINDRFGHMTGDEVLRTVAARLLGVVRDEDTVARLGGDEFAIVAADLARAEDAASVARRLLDALSAPFESGDVTALIGGSVGISLAPGDASRADTMMQNADLALYRVKRQGRGGVAFFTPDLDIRMRERGALSEDLRQALTTGAGIAVAYQPIVRLDDGMVIGMEALARWRHPLHGDVPPRVFVPLAEEAGVIGALGRAVLSRACFDLAAWRAEGFGHTWRCAVNVSAVQLRSEHFEQEVRDLVSQSGLSLGDLELEVTESAVMDHDGPALMNLSRLRAGGARVLIDDFGTGFSSLSRLTQFPVDAVKIDRSFVVALGDDDGARERAIVDAVVALAAGLGLGTVAEGIETDAQRVTVLAHGCSVGQGYLFARPQPASAIRERFLV